MIELTEQQRQELTSPEPVAIDPQTRAEYVLIRREIYERMRDLFSDDTVYTTAEMLDRVMAEDDANDPGLAELQRDKRDRRGQVMIPVPATQQAETVEQRFQRLAAVSRAEAGHLSSPTQMFRHPAYQEIIGLGQDVIPSLLRDLEKQPDHWFGALQAITGTQPVLPEDRGRINRMAAAWLRWAKEHGYQW